MDSNKTALISVRDLMKGFGATKVLRGVNFTVLPGEIHALLGGNGAGKSTMIRIITGAVRKDDGDVVLASPRGGIPKIAVVHQELALLPDLTVAENIALVHAASAATLVRNGSLIDQLTRELEMCTRRRTASIRELERYRLALRS